MALDRLADLKGGLGGQRMATAPKAFRDEEGEAGGMTGSGPMNAFWGKIRICQRVSKEVSLNMERQQELQQTFNTNSSAEVEKQLRNEFDTLQETNMKKLREVMKDIRGLETEYKQALKDSPDEPETRMMEGQILSISTQVKDLMKNSQECSIKFKELVKGKLKRQVKNIQGDSSPISDNKLDEMIENNPEALTQMMEAKVIGMPHLKVTNALKDIQDKCREIETLHSNVVKLYEMIKEISEMVHQQGKQVDSVLNNMEKARDYVDKGNKQLVKAKEYHQKARKKQCCIIMIAVVILCIILMPVLITVFK